MTPSDAFATDELREQAFQSWVETQRNSPDVTAEVQEQEPEAAPAPKSEPQEPAKSDPQNQDPIDLTVDEPGTNLSQEAEVDSIDQLPDPNYSPYSPPPTSDTHAGDTPITQTGEQGPDTEWTGDDAEDKWNEEWEEWNDEEWTGEWSEEGWTGGEDAEWNDDDWVQVDTTAEWWYDTEPRDRNQDHAWYDPDPSMRTDDESHRSADDLSQRRSPVTRDEEPPHTRRMDDHHRGRTPGPRNEESPYARRMSTNPSSRSPRLQDEESPPARRMEDDPLVLRVNNISSDNVEEISNDLARWLRAPLERSAWRAAGEQGYWMLNVQRHVWRQANPTNTYQLTRRLQEGSYIVRCRHADSTPPFDACILPLPHVLAETHIRMRNRPQHTNQCKENGELGKYELHSRH